MTRVLVTGGVGFIGAHVVRRLLARADDVVCLDDFNDFYDPKIKRANAQSFADDPNWTLIEGDICDQALVQRVFKEHKIDAVIHLAARAGVRPSVQDPGLYVDVNIGGTTHLLECAKDHGVQRFVFASSSSVYGGNTKIPFHEDDPVEQPQSPYAATKRAGELICRSFHHLYAESGALCSIPMLRFFTVYGPGQRPEMAISKFTQLMLDGAEIPMFGDGSSKRDYTYVEDIADAVVSSLDRGLLGCRVYNLGGGDPVRLDELIRLIGQALNIEPKIKELPMQPGDVLMTVSDCSKAAEEIGYVARVDLQEGLKRYVQWHRSLESGSAPR